VANRCVAPGVEPLQSTKISGAMHLTQKVWLNSRVIHLILVHRTKTTSLASLDHRSPCGRRR